MPSTVNRNPNGYLMCQPAGPVIRELIERRGHSVEGFVRMMRRTPSVRSAGLVPSSRTLWRACGGREVRIEYIRTIARGLRVRPGVISDWTGDDDIWDEPEMKASALDAKNGPRERTGGQRAGNVSLARITNRRETTQ